jgi:hypothetical protein
MLRREVAASIAALAALSGTMAAQTAGARGAFQLLHLGPCLADPVPASAPRYLVTGRVVDDLTGAGIPNAAVQLDEFCAVPDAPSHPAKVHWQARVASDERGEFRFDNVPAMAATLAAIREGYQDVLQDVPATAEAVSLAVRLPPYPSISGVVRSPDGAAMPGVSLMLYWYETWSGWRRLVLHGVKYTGADGAYCFPPPLAPGRYVLVAQPPRYGFSRLPPEPDAEGRVMGVGQHGIRLRQ